MQLVQHPAPASPSSPQIATPPRTALGMLELCQGRPVMCAPFSPGGFDLGPGNDNSFVTDGDEIVLKSVKFAPWAEAMTFDTFLQQETVERYRIERPGSPVRPQPDSGGGGAVSSSAGGEPKNARPSVTASRQPNFSGPNLAAVFNVPEHDAAGRGGIQPAARENAIVDEINLDGVLSRATNWGPPGSKELPKSRPNQQKEPCATVRRPPGDEEPPLESSERGSAVAAAAVAGAPMSEALGKKASLVSSLWRRSPAGRWLSQEGHGGA